MKKSLTCITLIFISLQAFASVELVWQVDLAPHLGTFEIPLYSGIPYESPVRQFSGDDVAILGYGGSSNIVLVLDKDANILISDAFSYLGAATLASFVGRSTREQFTLDLSNGADAILRIYEFDGTTTSVTNITIGPYGSSYSLSQFEEKVSQCFYTLNGKELSKYRITSNPVSIIGDVYAGIEGPNFKLTWDSISGQEYQMQSTTDLTNWVDVGTTIIGTGDLLSWANALTNSSSFFRVIEK